MPYSAITIYAISFEVDILCIAAFNWGIIGYVPELAKALFSLLRRIGILRLQNSIHWGIIGYVPELAKALFSLLRRIGIFRLQRSIHWGIIGYVPELAKALYSLLRRIKHPPATKQHSLGGLLAMYRSLPKLCFLFCGG